MTLRELFQSMNLTAYDLTVDMLDVHAVSLIPTIIITACMCVCCLTSHFKGSILAADLCSLVALEILIICSAFCVSTAADSCVTFFSSLIYSFAFACTYCFSFRSHFYVVSCFAFRVILTSLCFARVGRRPLYHYNHFPLAFFALHKNGLATLELRHQMTATAYEFDFP